MTIWNHAQPAQKVWCLKFIVFTLPFWMAMSVSAQTQQERQKQYLEDSLSINIKADHRHSISRPVSLQANTWQDWLERSGELPPDFSTMPSEPFLPDPLTTTGQSGAAIRNKEEWAEKREWIKEQFQHWVSGTIPPAPGDMEVSILSDTMDGQVRVQMVQLNFGPDNKARMTFELMVPPGEGPFPVYMTQWNHRDWAQLAVRRGYIGCVYAGADSKDDTQEYQELYPDYDFTGLMRRAWGASRVIDYLFTRSEVNKDQIAITGHSRNGKQSLWAGAFDDRIGAVITSSCGTGGITPWRYSDPQYCNQTLDDIASNAAHWFHPRLRFFFGREDKLPVDQNLLISLIAPRAVLFHYSTVETQLNPWVNEQCYHSVRSVYQFLGAARNIGIFPRMGEHAVAARDVERCIDFLDNHFGRRNIPWENRLTFDYSFEEWEKHHQAEREAAADIEPVKLQEKYADAAAFNTDKPRILANLDWLLGDEPAGVKPDVVAPTSPSRVDWIDIITGRPQVKNAKIINIGPYTAMGDHLAGALYVPTDDKGSTRTRTNGKLPVILYLHQYAYNHGYAYGYHEEGGRGNSKVFQKLTDAGFAVMAIDMFGFGTRLDEAKHFYTRQPGWSKMGKMVTDVYACVDALADFDFVDSDAVFLLGNTIGASVALIAAAQDERIDGVAVVAAFSPWRSSDSQYETIRTYSHAYGFLPRLGFFAENPKQVPVDFEEIVACVAPRPLLVIAPELDRHSNPEAVAASLSAAGNVYEAYGNSEELVTQTPREINRMTMPMVDNVVEFFQAKLNR